MAKILIIDDSMLSRGILKDFFIHHKFEFVEASDGEMGIEILRKEKPDCVLCDLLMPNVDGIRFLKAVQAEKIQVPVIIYTANSQEQVIKECMTNGAFEVYEKSGKLNKSPEQEDFLKLINRALVHGKALLGEEEEYSLTNIQRETLSELVNIGMGRAAKKLNNYLDCYITLEPPTISVLHIKNMVNLLQTFGDSSVSSVRQAFEGPFSGRVALIFPQESACSLVSAMTGEPEGTTGLDSVRAGTVCEVGNILINSVIGAICNVLEVTVAFNVPRYIELPIQKLMEQMDIESKSNILLVKTQFSIEQLKIEGSFIVLLDTKTFDTLIMVVNKLAAREGESYDDREK